MNSLDWVMIVSIQHVLRTELPKLVLALETTA